MVRGFLADKVQDIFSSYACCIRCPGLFKKIQELADNDYTYSDRTGTKPFQQFLTELIHQCFISPTHRVPRESNRFPGETPVRKISRSRVSYFCGFFYNKLFPGWAFHLTIDLCILICKHIKMVFTTVQENLFIMILVTAKNML